MLSFLQSRYVSAERQRVRPDQLMAGPHSSVGRLTGCLGLSFRYGGPRVCDRHHTELPSQAVTSRHAAPRGKMRRN